MAGIEGKHRARRNGKWIGTGATAQRADRREDRPGRRVHGRDGTLAAGEALVGRPLRLRVTLRSVTDGNLPVQYRFVFLGKDGDAVSDDPTWQSVTFAPRTTPASANTAVRTGR